MGVHKSAQIYRTMKAVYCLHLKLRLVEQTRVQITVQVGRIAHAQITESTLTPVAIRRISGHTIHRQARPLTEGCSDSY